MTDEPIDWLKRRRECKKCHGLGYVPAPIFGKPKRVQLCDCRPRTMSELREAAEQERKANA